MYDVPYGLRRNREFGIAVTHYMLFVFICPFYLFLSEKKNTERQVGQPNNNIIAIVTLVEFTNHVDDF